MSYKCEILADSMSPQGNRLTTMKVTFPRFILAEFNTHRMFSRNSASSRAIPFKKMVKMVEENPFIPIAWQKDHSGMQGTEYFQDTEIVVDGKIANIKTQWLRARDLAVQQAKRLNECGVTKQLCNRLLEPFMWHTVICTSSEWENFFNLRCPQYQIIEGGEFYRSKKDVYKDYNPEKGSGILDKDDIHWLKLNTSQAEIHIQAIAELMWDILNESTPKQLEAGEYHIPFGENISYEDLCKLSISQGFTNLTGSKQKQLHEQYKIKIAVARCARISYETLGDNPKIDYKADLKLYDILSKSGHFSPLEHVARVMSKEEYLRYVNGYNFSNIYNKNYDDLSHDGFGSDDKGWCRNFKGFIQQRALIDN